MEIVPLTPDRYDDLAELFDTTVVTRSCYCTWFLLLDPERREVWLAGGARSVFEEGAPGGLPPDRQARPHAAGGLTCRW
jgi:hypothetical protein